MQNFPGEFEISIAGKKGSNMSLLDAEFTLNLFIKVNVKLKIHFKFASNYLAADWMWICCGFVSKVYI